jgi:hypothetical protein
MAKKIIKLEVGTIVVFNILKIIILQTFVLNDSTKDKFKKEMCSYGQTRILSS